MGNPQRMHPSLMMFLGYDNEHLYRITIISIPCCRDVLPTISDFPPDINPVRISRCLSAPVETLLRTWAGAMGAAFQHDALL